MRSLLATFALTGLLSLPGCGGGSDQNATDPPLPPDPPVGQVLYFEQAGGEIGTFESLTVMSDGKSVLRSRDLPTVRFRLSGREMSRLAVTLNRHPVSELGEPVEAPACADCFTYRIDFDAGSYRADSATISRSASGLVRNLNGVIDAHRPIE